jgi:uncharacterized protein
VPLNESNRHREDLLDETLEATFPASDAPSNTVQTGIRVGEPPEPQVRDNRDAGRFEIEVGSHVAFLRYERRGNSLALVHTEVPEALRGRRIGDKLAKAGIEAARSEGLTLVAICPFVRAYLRKHPAEAPAATR